jgi:hypothetical protein
MNRYLATLPPVPASEMAPHYHPPGARCLTCTHWTGEANPNFGRCAMFDERRNSDWSCLLWMPVAP